MSLPQQRLAHGRDQAATAHVPEDQHFAQNGMDQPDDEHQCTGQQYASPMARAIRAPGRTIG
ncbi:hypothetical protein [Bosea sp. LC85]|uniref:hypothetical protein n=1 Tax=Bosea sp. LC85 TaxID=1502851 RepID=UPI0013766938|nr:hypothetical protein [Bosea sp. LC85]